MAEVTYIITGDPRTKKNSPQILYKGARCPACKKGKIPFVMPSAAFKKYEARALTDLHPRPQTPIECPVNVKCLYYMQTLRDVDLGNLLAATCDILVDARILKDDKSKIVVSHDGSRVLYSPDNPRCEITITRVQVDEQMSMFGGTQ